MDRRAELADREVEVWAEFEAALAAIPEDRWELEGILPGWSVRDLVRHVAGWLEDCVRQLGRMREGTFEEPNDSPAVVDAKNAAFAEEARAMTTSQVRSGLVSARELVREWWAVLPMIDDPAIEWFVGETFEHYEEHLPELRRFAGD
jgi:uncharacterized protein (TIGR03083 family)